MRLLICSRALLQVPITPLDVYTLFSFPEEPRWTLNMDFTVNNPNDFGIGSQKALASYGPQSFLDINRTACAACAYTDVVCGGGGWALYLADGKLSLWSNSQAYESETLNFNFIGSTHIQAFLSADEDASIIKFNITSNSAGGCYSSISGCSNSVSGNLDFSGFTRKGETCLSKPACMS